MPKNYLFQETKYCQSCNKTLPPNHTDSLCPSCAEIALFQVAKDFIRSGDYNEYDVSQFLNIPIQQIRRWIREGRIQYKEDSLNNITMHCQVCGAQITFGTMCPKCLKAQNVSGSSSIYPAFDSGNMRHLKITNLNGADQKNPSKN